MSHQDIQRKNKTKNNSTKKLINVKVITPIMIIITIRLLITGGPIMRTREVVIKI